MAVLAIAALSACSAPPATRVEAVYPGTAEVPENLLKLYVGFSAPMSRDGAAAHVHLLTAAGAAVPAPFVAPEVELWSPDRRRLTLIFDPGRLKREVGPNRDLGPVLVAGETYRLRIDAGWPDAAGRPLAAGLEKTFRAGPADREAPRIDDWTVELPARSAAPLVLRFREPLDRALLEWAIRVEGDGGIPVAGSAEVGEGERSWSFRPAGGWRSGDYEVVAAAVLEDLAGNSLRRPFETELGASPGSAAVAEVRRSFKVSL